MGRVENKSQEKMQRGFMLVICMPVCSAVGHTVRLDVCVKIGDSGHWLATVVIASRGS